jgi:hypothetical protein
MEQLSQKTLENQYQKQQNFFYESISTKLKAYSEDQAHLLNLLNSVKENEISLEQFEVLGCFSYLVGIDYTNQVKLTEEVINRVRERFEVFGFSEKVLQGYSHGINKVSEKSILPAKDKLKNQITNEIFVSTENKLLFNNLRSVIKKIFNNSLLPVSMSVPVNELINKKSYTFDDILKINSAINIQCKFVGKVAVKNLIKLYNDKLWVEYLQSALILFDNQKFAVVYLDGILSVKESKKKLAYNIFDSISKTIEFNDILCLEEIPVEVEVSVEEEISEETHIKEEEQIRKLYVKVTDEEIALASKEKPVDFIYHVICEALGYIPENTEDIFKALEKSFQEEDYIQHIYHYMKSQGKLVKVGDTFPENVVSISDLILSFDEKIIKMREEYKQALENICEEIDENKIHKIVSYVNVCIGDLVLVTEDQKQYLTSQLIENNITTYQHLMQTLELIENCDIIGEQLISYVILHKYLDDLTEVKEKFELSKNTEGLQTKLSIYIGFSDFFKRTLEVSVKEIN